MPLDVAVRSGKADSLVLQSCGAPAGIRTSNQQIMRRFEGHQRSWNQARCSSIYRIVSRQSSLQLAIYERAISRHRESAKDKLPDLHKHRFPISSSARFSRASGNFSPIPRVDSLDNLSSPCYPEALEHLGGARGE